MATILHLETATTNCSVSIAKDGEMLVLKENNAANYSHSEQLHIFIKEALEEASLLFSDLDAVAISKGPGSYTGLRIGVSSAKGLCFSLDIPLVSVPTLQSMAHQTDVKPGELVIPVLDARRMEVYSCVYDAVYNEVRETRAEIIDEDSFADYVSDDKVYIIGSGAEKCRGALEHPNFIFDESVVPSAKDMVPIAFEKYKSNEFEDVAYFEPYYLKDFVLQQKKKKN
ncbi:tRNA (adenosine(37)-N6)-threonylcarbamoyltransferase complex dimerization subunit type 1 TsaB [Muricauda oceani]|uniref:tRNA (Adenosine(37)-N6)-threonylcarbamoyltransferase complex dimerization subunit type 1 TsaB n=1 Tax=Flagellimonas oceani TaxID=2698672 RepID=A0A6G7J8L4_9FLAO|nr:tRNA (adenosine(37)-N6)-threonylcarbamoyltransferase complex dimerization subunit type 1 TsaB [Allomuricauda oceani]MBW8242123.1 tRNA (adenosine(37)-N6)-threonylcarbamoyltransferase complex dimerization subunit type 1 TsaB [Allomuricauda oceani]QII47030.1 tRNA (adenosine(37)-N6)-threonylcarbamoyltransferase complex dimerization subunit type 1 TsaB [Allomuricauda oceani]